MCCHPHDSTVSFGVHRKKIKSPTKTDFNEKYKFFYSLDYNLPENFLEHILFNKEANKPALYFSSILITLADTKQEQKTQMKAC